MADGTTNWPTDAAGQTAVGMDIGGNKYYLYGDNTTNKGLIVALRDASGVALLTATNPAYVNAAGIATAITQTPTVSSSPAYSAGDAVGGKLTFASAVRSSGGTGIVQAVILADKGKQAVALDLILFNADPSGTTFTDNAALTIADADLLKIIGHVAISTSDYSSFADNAVATKTGLGLAFKAVGSTSIYGCLVARGTPTYTSTSDVQVVVTILQDA